MNKESVIIINYTGRKGGGALDAFETAKALVECGQKVIPIISNQIENLDMWKKVKFEKIVTIDTYNSKLSFALNTMLFPFKQKKQIRNALHTYDIKAVYCPMSSFWTVPINKIFKDSRIITVNHDPISHSGASRFAVWLMERPFKSSDVIIVHSKKFVEYTEKKYGRTEYIPLCQHNLYRNINNKKTIISYNPNKINFLFFGRIANYKGLDVLEKAYRKLSAEFDDSITLNVVGNGDFSTYKEQYRDLKNVTIINRWISDEEVESAFVGENIVCVCPYKDATQSGVVLLAYDYGVPVIASNTGGLDEQVINDQTGILIPPNNVDALYCAMKEFILNDKKIKEMQIHIADFLKNISWEVAAKKIVEITDEVK